MIMNFRACVLSASELKHRCVSVYKAKKWPKVRLFERFDCCFWRDFPKLNVPVLREFPSVTTVIQGNSLTKILQQGIFRLYEWILAWCMYSLLTLILRCFYSRGSSARTNGEDNLRCFYSEGASIRRPRVSVIVDNYGRPLNKWV